MPSLPFFQLPLWASLFFLFCFLLYGCASYKVATSMDPNSIEVKDKAHSHWLYSVVPRHRDQIKWYDVGHWSTWVLFGNDDEGIFGEDTGRPYRPDQPDCLNKFLSWWMRNPLHNFTFYMIGSAHRVNSEWALLRMSDDRIHAFEYDPVAKHNFGGRGSSFFLGFHGWKPFISLRLCYFGRYMSQFYLGWRKEGNFGIKLQLLTKRKEPRTKDKKVNQSCTDQINKLYLP